MLISSTIGYGSRGFAHPVKVDVRLVSFPRPAFEMTCLQNYDPLHNAALCTAVSFTRARWRPCSWLRQLSQCFLQFGQSVDFRHGTLQRVHRGSDMREEMFVTLDQAEKSVST